MTEKSVEELEREASLDEIEAKELAMTRPAIKSTLKSYVLGFAILIVLGAFDYWLFRTFFKTTPHQWYLKNGTLIGFVTSVVATTWGDLNKNTALISPNPLRYLAASALLIGLPLYSLGTHLRSGEDRGTGRSPLDLFLTVPFVFIIAALLLVWVVVVAPLQYFIYLICGAPARWSLQSAWRPVARFSARGEMMVEQVPYDGRVPTGWWDASLFNKPVSITGLISSILFFILHPLLY